MMYARFSLSLDSFEDLLHARGIDICYEVVRFWFNRFGQIFAVEIRWKRVDRMQLGIHWQWHLDEVFVKINVETHCIWRAVDHEGEILKSFFMKLRDRKAALKFLRKAMKRHGSAHVFVTDKLRYYGAAMKVIGIVEKQETGRWLNN
jgi:putative transposase